jgi:hypothetical protein
MLWEMIVEVIICEKVHKNVVKFRMLWELRLFALALSMLIKETND